MLGYLDTLHQHVFPRAERELMILLLIIEITYRHLSPSPLLPKYTYKTPLLTNHHTRALHMCSAILNID